MHNRFSFSAAALALGAAALTFSVTAAPGGGRDNFLGQQAMEEVQRLSGQVEVLQANQEDLAQRLGKTDAARSEIEQFRTELAALRASVEELRRQMRTQREEIVKDLVGRIKQIQPPAPPPAPAVVTPPPSAPAAHSGPTRTYTVERGDTLSLIADAFNTKVSTIKAMNGLKNDNIRVGQKLVVPDVK